MPLRLGPGAGRRFAACGAVIKLDPSDEAAALRQLHRDDNTRGCLAAYRVASA